MDKKVLAIADLTLRSASESWYPSRSFRVALRNLEVLHNML